MMRMMRSLAVLAWALAVLGGYAGPAGAQSADSLRNKVNEGTIGLISGGVNGTYIRIASDLAAVLDSEGKLRILPIVGKGSVQNITDLLYLKGVDIGIVQSDVMAYAGREKLHPSLAQRIRYITKLYNEEVHILARAEIGQLADLAGRKVNVDVVGSGTAMTAATLLEAVLGVKVEATHLDQQTALQQLKDGQIAAMVYVVGKPADLFSKVAASDNLHFLPVPLSEGLLKTYIPSSLTHADYPALVPEGRSLDTVAVSAVMAVYNWDPGNERYRRVAAFVSAFFDNIGEFLKPPRHAKWQEVNLAAELPGWTRFQPAQDWLDRRPTTAGAGYDIGLKSTFDEFLAFMSEGGGDRAAPVQNREAMFARFVEWRRHQQEQPAAETINILTGSTSGVYFPLGSALAGIFTTAIPGAKVTVTPTQGSVQNLTLLQARRGEVAFALGDSVGAAWRGESSAGFDGKLDRLRTIASIYPNYIQIVARRDSAISRLADLKGKRVSVGAPRSGTELNARRVFQAAGLSYEMMAVQYLPFDESVALMKQGELDATLQSTGLGVASLRDLSDAISVVFVPVPPEVVNRIGDPAFLAKPIPAGTYRGQDREVMTATVNNLLMTRADVPADVVYAMTKALFDNLANLAAVHPAAKGLSLAGAVQGSPVPLHPGAERFYRQARVLR